MSKIFVVLSTLCLLLAPNGQPVDSQTSTDAHFGDGAIILLPIEEHDEYDTMPVYIMRWLDVSSADNYATGISIFYGDNEHVTTTYVWELNTELLEVEDRVLRVRPTWVETYYPDGHGFYAGAISPNEQYAISYGSSVANVVRLADFEIVESFPLENELYSDALSYWSPDSRYVGVKQSTDPEPDFIVWDMESERSGVHNFHGFFNVLPLEEGWLLLGRQSGVFEFCTMLLDSCESYSSEEAEGSVATPDGAVVYTYIRTDAGLSITQWQRQSDNPYNVVFADMGIDTRAILREVSPDGDYISTDPIIWRTSDWQRVGSTNIYHKYSPDSRYVVRFAQDELDLYQIEPFALIDSISVSEQLETDITDIFIEDTSLVGFSPDGKWVLLQLGTFAAMIPVDYE